LKNLQVDHGKQLKIYGESEEINWDKGNASKITTTQFYHL